MAKKKIQKSMARAKGNPETAPRTRNVTRGTPKKEHAAPLSSEPQEGSAAQLAPVKTASPEARVGGELSLVRQAYEFTISPEQQGDQYQNHGVLMRLE